MDLRAILNKSERPASGTAARQPQRSASLAQPLIQHQPPPVPPSLARQQSYPSYLHVQDQYPNQPPHPHTSYAPHREEYFRNQSLSVSPKTLPTSIPRERSQSPHVSQNSHFHAEQARLDSASLSTPARSHTREHSTHSIISNNSSVHRETLSARDQPTHSPQFFHPASVTSSPIQARAPDYYVAYPAVPTQSPVEARSASIFRHPTHSPTQTNAMPPPITPVLSQQASPPPQPIQTPTRQSPVAQAHSSRSGSIVLAENNITENVDTSRKRSLESIGDQQGPPKRRRHESVPKWAQRTEWKPQKQMDQWIPAPRTQSDSRPDTKPSRVPQVKQDDTTPSRVPSVIKEESNGPPLRAQTNGSDHAKSSRSYDFSPIGNYELSLDDHVPFSDVTREVAEFLWDYVVLFPNLPVGQIEVEAKLGTIIDPHTNSRINVPVMTEAVLPRGFPARFQSLMSIQQHKSMNDYLNVETERARNDPKRVKIKYEHLRETDTFYEAPEHFLESLPEPIKRIREEHSRHTPRVRVTVDAQTKQVKATIIKFRIADLEIFCPKDAFDVRLSVSLEVDYPGSPDSLMASEIRHGDVSSRYKDRLSYKHQFVSIDLTQVRPDNGGERRHELELEINTDLLRKEGNLAQNGQPNHYEGVVGIFTNYIRVINRTCRMQ